MSSEKPFQSGNERATNERVQRALTEMQQRRREFQDARQVGQPGDRLHLSFQSVILEVHDVLRPYRGDVAEEWREATRWDDGLEALPKAVGARPVREVRETGIGRETVELEYRPQLLRPTHLLEISYELDEIAKELGFETQPERELPDIQDGGVME